MENFIYLAIDPFSEQGKLRAYVQRGTVITYNHYPRKRQQPPCVVRIKNFRVSSLLLGFSIFELRVKPWKLRHR